MAINYHEGLKRLKRLAGIFWLGSVAVVILLLGLLFLVINIIAVLLQVGFVPWDKIAILITGLILLGGIGYFATVRFSDTVVWIIKGFTD